MSLRPTFVLQLALCCVLSGCGIAGPNLIENARPNYNEVLWQTSKDQLLENLLRVKFNDEPYFLEVSQVTNQMALGASLSASGQSPVSHVHDYTYGGAANISETPTVTFVPVVGEAYVKQLLTPISYLSMESLYDSDWELCMLLRLTVDKLPGVTPGNLDAVIDKLQELDDLGAVDILVPEASPGSDNGGSKGANVEKSQTTLRSKLTFCINFDTSSDPAKARQLYNDLKSLLVLGQGMEEWLTPQKEMTSSQGIPTTRITFPESVPLNEDLRGGEAPKTRSPLGCLNYAASKWTKILDTAPPQGTDVAINAHERVPIVINIITSKMAPASNIFASAYYHGQWYYVDVNDHTTCRALNLLSLLMTIQAAPVEASGVVLTIPAGGS